MTANNEKQNEHEQIKRALSVVSEHLAVSKQALCVESLMQAAGCLKEIAEAALNEINCPRQPEVAPRPATKSRMQEFLGHNLQKAGQLQKKTQRLRRQMMPASFRQTCKPERTRFRQLWHRLKRRGLLGDEWCSVATFIIWCLQEKPDKYSRLKRHNDQDAHSPGNSYFVLPFSAVASHFGCVSKETALWRVNHGWEPVKAVSTPARFCQRLKQKNA